MDSVPEVNSPFNVQVTSSSRVFPERSQTGSVTVPLSIVDATVAGFAPCAATWYFDAPKGDSALSSEQWKRSLSRTLNGYPQWCGHLFWSKSPSPTSGHSDRFSRPHVTYNNVADPGVLFVAATSSRRLADFIPSVSARRSTQKAWDASGVRALDGLLPEDELAPTDDSSPDAPAMIIQITTFECGGIAVSIMSAHCLSDAHSLSLFVKDWSNTSRALLKSESLPTLSPCFNPRLLDSTAAGDVDAEKADPTIQEVARKLPLHRFDWYIQVENQPWKTTYPKGYDASAPVTQSDPLPWADWDATATSIYQVLHFSSSEIQHIYDSASATGSKISKHDALLAHMWILINRARANLPEDTVYLDLTFGLRPRLSPPLPDTFLGSPIMLTAIPSSSLEASTTSSLPLIASRIRSTLESFTPTALAAHLHDAAFEYCPQRIWLAFLGRKHLLLTTWLYLDLYTVDFGLEPESLRAVQPVMSFMDGIVNVVEARGPLGGEKGHWSKNGVDVHVYLEKEAMGRLVRDGELWGSI